MSEPGASPRLLTKDTAAPGCPSISAEAKFLPVKRNPPLVQRAGLRGGGWTDSGMDLPGF